MEDQSLEGRNDCISKGSVVTVGCFDGVHRGHLGVLRSLKEFGQRECLRPLVITFDRHPLSVVTPLKAPRLLITPDERDRLLRREGVEVVRIPFDEKVASLTAGEWLERLKQEYDAKAFLTGYDNKFGRDGRNMSHSDYEALAQRHGMKTATAPEVKGVSSTMIRRAVEAGDVKRASDLMGRPYSLSGKVVEGKHLGRTIGFPTANIAVDPSLLLPAAGVYSALTSKGRAVVNVGTNPTVGEGNPVTIEAYLIDFSGDIYGEELQLSFMERLRGEMKFPDLEALRKQIRTDVERVKMENCKG